MNFEKASSTSSDGSLQSVIIRVLVCAGAMALIVVALAAIAYKGMNVPFAIYTLFTMVIPSVITVLWLRASGRSGSWLRTSVTFLIVYLAIVVLWRVEGLLVAR